VGSGILIADAQRSAAQGFPGALALALSHLRSASYSAEAAATSVTMAASTASGAGVFTASASTALAVRRNTGQLGQGKRTGGDGRHAPPARRNVP
jgi:hypothetical protein